MQTAAYRLRAGDRIRYEGKPCRVLRGSDCAAMVAVTRPTRTVTTLFDKRGSLQPHHENKPPREKSLPGCEGDITKEF